ncbi:phosphotransferase family protein [Flindersiella endophytica]
MELTSVQREQDAFQQQLTAAQISALCERAFGPEVSIRSAVELGNGGYNTTYRIDLDPERVILRVAPAPERQYRSERELLRNEYAALPYFAPVAALLPRTLAADFTHELIGRDYLFQSELAGVPVPEGIGRYPRPEWVSMYRQLGTITRHIHDVRGPQFGPIAGPWFATWSQALLAELDAIAADLDTAGLEAADIRTLAAAATQHRSVLDQITEPRLLHGDLWTINLMLTPNAPQPTICGLFDCERASWGDPAADWTIRMALRRPGTERDTFWQTYGPPDNSPNARLRALIYHARHTAALLLERHRHHKHDEDLRLELHTTITQLS